MRNSGGNASGIISAVLMVIGIFLLVGDEIESMTNEELHRHFADSGNRMTELAGFVLVLIGGLLFLWFLSALRVRLQSAEETEGTLSMLGFGAGVAAAALLVAAAVLLVATAAGVEYLGNFEADPNIVRFAVSGGYLLLLCSVVVNCALVLSTSVLVMRTGVLPGWFAWVGFVAVVVAIVEAVLLPVFTIPVWVLIASVLLTTQAPSDAAVSPTAS